MSIKLEPYSRGVRPVLPGSFPQYMDAELQKLSVTILQLVQVIKDQDARITALGAK